MKEPHSARDTERLRSLLTRTRPAVGGLERGQIAGRGLRDRRRRVVMSSLLALAVAALVITPQFLNKTRTTNLRNDLTNRLAGDSQASGSDPGTTTPCPTEPRAQPADSAPGVVRAGVSSLRLCGGGSLGSAGGSPRLPPADALLLDSGSTLFADVARLPEEPANHCKSVSSGPDGSGPSSPEANAASRPEANAASGPEANAASSPDPYVLLVGYSDGTVEQLYLASGCDDITVAGIRHDASAVLALLRAAVAAQP